MDSLENNRTNYLLDVVETGASVHSKPSKLDFGAGASYLSPRVGQGTDSRFASTEEVFGPATTPGLGTNTDFIKISSSRSRTVTVPSSSNSPSRRTRSLRPVAAETLTRIEKVHHALIFLMA
jgi:hypothetical protein